MHVIRLDVVLLRFAVTSGAALAIALSPWAPEASVSSAAALPVGATLKVLVSPVEVQLDQSDLFVPATDGQMLNQGDVVRTGLDGLALVTFFDGSESQLGGETTVQIERAEAIPTLQIALLQTAGVTLNHVVPMPPGGSFRTDTPAATGLVRGTSYVVVVGGGGERQASDGRDWSVCGSTHDESCATSVVLLTDRDGHVGRVDVAARGSSVGVPLQLSAAGDAAVADAGQSTAASVATVRLQALEAGSNARNLPQAALAAERQALIVASALVQLASSAHGSTSNLAPEGGPVLVEGSSQSDDRSGGSPQGLVNHVDGATQATAAATPSTSAKLNDDKKSSGSTGQSAPASTAPPASGVSPSVAAPSVAAASPATLVRVAAPVSVAPALHAVAVVAAPAVSSLSKSGTSDKAGDEERSGKS